MSHKTEEKFKHEYKLPPVDFNDLEGSIKSRIFTEINYSLGLIREDTYFTKYTDNAETLERDLEILEEMDEIDEIIQDEEFAKKCLLRFIEGEN